MDQVSVDVDTLRGMGDASTYTVRDVWARKDLGPSHALAVSARLGPHASFFVVVTATS